jgi:hypothetical protein
MNSRASLAFAARKKRHGSLAFSQNGKGATFNRAERDARFRGFSR